MTSLDVLIAGGVILLVLAGHASYWVTAERAVRRRERKAAAALDAALKAEQALIRPRIAGELAVDPDTWPLFLAEHDLTGLDHDPS